MTKVQRRAMALADVLASREIAKQRDTWRTTQDYWNEQVARARIALKQALKDAGMHPNTSNVGVQMPMPWKD